MFGTALVASGLFVATNIDSLVVTTALVAADRAAGNTDRWRIWFGQSVGMIAAVAAAAAVALGSNVIPVGYLALIGAIPIALGIRGLWHARRAAAGDDLQLGCRVGFSGALLLTLSNSTDNVTGYAPVFRGYTFTQLAVTMGVFGVGAVLWCIASLLFASHRGLAHLLGRTGRWIVPAVLIVVGLNAVYRGLRSY